MQYCTDTQFTIEYAQVMFRSKYLKENTFSYNIFK